MSRWTPRLLVIAALAGILGAALFAAVGGHFEASSARIAQRWAEQDAQPHWHWALRGGAAALGLGLVVQFIAQHVPVGLGGAPAGFASLGERAGRAAVAEVRRRLGQLVAADEPNIISALDEILRGARATGSSDVHISPGRDGTRVTYRSQGALLDVALLPTAVAPLLAMRIKVLARLDSSIAGKPQDGRLARELDGALLEVRVSTLPTESGERVVMRLLRGGVSLPDLEHLGFEADTDRRLRDLLSRPQGLLFVTGPVGAGKSTTLYAALGHIAATRGQTATMVTLEDPIEIHVPFATQTQINPRAGLTFAGTLRSVLRQDPNVLMVGEIRDPETAEIAVQAGLTGHLLLTTVHGESAAAPFPRLAELGVEPYVLASAALGSLSQRLVRVLCTACRRLAEPEPLHRQRVEAAGLTLPPGAYYEPVGCTFCEHQGFTGRLAIAELLVVDAEVRQAINARAGTQELHALAVSRGMQPLLLDGLRRAAAGETSLAEVLRVCG